MSNVSQLPQAAERRERRLHLREVSSTEPQTPSSVGAKLRAARLERGEEKIAVAAKLKMRPEQLDAIEADDFARLPGRTYAVGFVRAYARHLELDVEAVLQQFKDETATEDYAKPVDLVFPEAAPEVRLPNGSLLFIMLAIAVVIYGLSYLTMPPRKATTARAEDSIVVIDEPQAVAQASTEPEGPTDVALFVQGDARLPEPTLPDAAPTIASPQTVLDEPVQMMSFGVADKEFAVASVPPSGDETQSRVTLTALQPTYIQIRERLGKKTVLVSRLLSPGETYRAPDLPDLIMQTGNAGGLQVEVDGRVLGVLGRSGQVITRIPVDPTYFLERLVVTQ